MPGKYWADKNKVPNSGTLQYGDYAFPEKPRSSFTEFYQLKKGPPAEISELTGATAKHGNAFVNSRRGGVLMFGVDERGVVRGIEFDKDIGRHEYERSIKNVLREFHPRLQKGYHYEIRFIRVDGLARGDLWVIAIIIRPFWNRTMKEFCLVKTRFGGEIYVRSKRRGEVIGPLTGPEKVFFIEKRNLHLSHLSSHHETRIFETLANVRAKRERYGGFSGGQIPVIVVDKGSQSDLEDDDDKIEDARFDRTQLKELMTTYKITSRRRVDSDGRVDIELDEKPKKKDGRISRLASWFRRINFRSRSSSPNQQPSLPEEGVAEKNVQQTMTYLSVPEKHQRKHRRQGSKKQ